MSGMTAYGQFCPVAKATEILGDTWSMLIVRELLLGSTRFSQFQRGLPKISPTVLNTRLKSLETDGVIVRRPVSGQRGHDYRLTPAGRELAPLVEALAVWGMRWARDEMEDADYDVSFLMFDIERNILRSELPDGDTVLCFQFPDLDDFGTWWIVVTDDGTDLCYQDPGHDVSAYLTATSHDLIGIWMGDIPLGAALEDARLKVFGDGTICKRLRKWFPRSSAADVPRPERAGA